MVYSAEGSHGLYAKPGKHVYRKLPNGDKLADYTSRGKSWRTWENLQFILFQPKKLYEGRDSWMNYKGRWGNRKQSCGIYERVSGQCQLNDGPVGPVEKSVLTNIVLE